MKNQQFNPRLSMIINQRSLQSQDSFKQWRACETIHTIFAIAGLLLAAIDYEINYSFYRTASNCLEDSTADEFFRLIITFSTLLSIFFLVLRYFIKNKWEAHLEHSKLNLPIRQSQILIDEDEDGIINQNFKFPGILCLEIILLLIFPYPNVYWKFYVPLRYNFETYQTCYTLLEVTYFIMHFRCIFLLRALANYSPYENYLARLYCKKHNVNPDINFSFKCIFRKAPIIWTIIAIQIPTIFLLGTTLRVIERPLSNITEQDFTSPWQAWYLIFCMMAILGFGPVWPFTVYGRFFGCILGYAIGRFGFTMLFYKSEKAIVFDEKQHKAFISILGTSAAATVIQNGMRYMISRKKRGPEHPETLDYLWKFKKAILEFKDKREEVSVLDNTQDKIARDLRQKIKNIDAKLDRSIKQAEKLLRAPI